MLSAKVFRNFGIFFTSDPVNFSIILSVVFHHIFLYQRFSFISIRCKQNSPASKITNLSSINLITYTIWRLFKKTNKSSYEIPANFRLRNKISQIMNDLHYEAKLFILCIVSGFRDKDALFVLLLFFHFL